MNDNEGKSRMIEGNEEPLEFFCANLAKQMRESGATDDQLSAGMFMRMGVALALAQPAWAKGYIAIYEAGVGYTVPQEGFDTLVEIYPIEDQGKPHIDLDVN